MSMDPPWMFVDFQGSPTDFQGIPVDPRWLVKDSLGLHGFPWIPHSFPRISTDSPWVPTEFHGIPWTLHGSPWIPGMSHGLSWIPMDCPWIFKDTHGFLMTKDNCGEIEGVAGACAHRRDQGAAVLRQGCTHSDPQGGDPKGCCQDSTLLRIPCKASCKSPRKVLVCKSIPPVPPPPQPVKCSEPSVLPAVAHTAKSARRLADLNGVHDRLTAAVYRAFRKRIPNSFIIPPVADLGEAGGTRAAAGVLRGRGPSNAQDSAPVFPVAGKCQLPRLVPAAQQSPGNGASTDWGTASAIYAAHRGAEGSRARRRLPLRREGRPARRRGAHGRQIRVSNGVLGGAVLPNLGEQ
eukprot:gene23775-biopygen17856